VDQTAPIEFGDLRIPCTIWRGLVIADAPMDTRFFHPPGTHGTIVRMLGILPRPIIVPVCLHSREWNRYEYVAAYLQRLLEVKAKGREQNLTLPVADTELKFSRCYLENWQPSPRGIQRDEVNGLGPGNRWFIEGVLTFVQTVPVPNGSPGSEGGGSGDISRG